MRCRKCQHCGRHNSGTGQQISLIAKMIDERTHNKRRAEYSKVEQEEQISLFREIDLQACPHRRQAEHSAQNGEHDAKHQNAGTSTEEQDARAWRLAHNYRFSERS